MENKPKIIYLQIGTDEEIEDFKHLVDVSWCSDKINKTDIEYVLKSDFDTILKDREALIECLDVFISFANSGHIPDESTTKETEDLLNNLKTK